MSLHGAGGAVEAVNPSSSKAALRLGSKVHFIPGVRTHVRKNAKGMGVSPASQRAELLFIFTTKRQALRKRNFVLCLLNSPLLSSNSFSVIVGTTLE